MSTNISPELLSRMGTTFDRFRERIVASNRAYLRDIVQVIEGLNLPQTEALNKMFQALPTITLVPYVKDFDSPRAVAEGILATDLDGVYFPPVSKEKREEFFALLSEEVNEYIREEEGYGDHDNFTPLPLPEEYMALLHYCDSIQDPDLRVINPGGLFGTWLVWPQGEKVGVFTETSVDDAVMQCHLVDDGWEFRTAFTIDMTPEMIFCTYGYCRRMRDFIPRPERAVPREPAEHECEWKWRIFYFGPLQSETNMIFDTLPEYLDWLAGWYDREVHGDLTMATKQVSDPPFLEGVTDVSTGTYTHA